MKYIVNTPKRGLFLNPTKYWNGKKGFEFMINRISDSEYAKDKS